MERCDEENFPTMAVMAPQQQNLNMQNTNAFRRYVTPQETHSCLMLIEHPVFWRRTLLKYDSRKNIHNIFTKYVLVP